MAPRDELIGPQPAPGYWAGRTDLDGRCWRPLVRAPATNHAGFMQETGPPDLGPVRFDSLTAAVAHLDRITIDVGDFAVVCYEQPAPDDPHDRVTTEDVYLCTATGYLWVERRGPIIVRFNPGGGFA